MINVTAILNTSAANRNRAIAIEAYERFIQDRINAEHKQQWSEYLLARTEYERWANYQCSYVANCPIHVEQNTAIQPTNTQPVLPRKMTEPQGRIHLLQENLHDALRKAAKFVSSKPSNPVLANVMLQESRDRLLVTTATFEYAFRTSVLCKSSDSMVLEPIDTTIPAKLALEYVALCDHEIMSMTQYVQKIDALGKPVISLNWAQRTNTANWATIPSGQFIHLPAEGQHIATIYQVEQWITALKACVTVSAKEDNRPILQGVLVEFHSDGTARIAATDGYRLTRHNLKADVLVEHVAIVPAKPLTSVLALLDKDKPIDIYHYYLKGNDAGRISIKQGDDEYIIENIEGKFPAIDLVIPKGSAMCADVDIDSLLKALKGRKWGKDERVKLTFVESDHQHVMGKVKLQSIERGYDSELDYTFDAAITGQGFEIGLTASLLISTLKAIADTIPAEKYKVTSRNTSDKLITKTVTKPRYVEISGKNQTNPIQITAGHQLSILMPASLR